MSECFGRVGSKSTVATCVVLAALTPLGGCSFLLVKPPRKEAPGRIEAADCTASNTVPALDGVVAGLQGIRTMYAVSLSNADYRGMALDRDSDIAFGALLMALFGISAVYGASAVNACRAAGGEVSVTPHRRPATPYQRPATKQTSAERKAEEAAEEAAVQARLEARAAAASAAADASAADDPNADAGASPDGGAPAVAPNQRRDDGR